MFNLDISANRIRKMALEALVSGVLWGLLFYFVRKRLNKRNFVQDAENKKISFYWDGVYGGLAAALMVITKSFVMEFTSNILL